MILTPASLLPADEDNRLQTLYAYDMLPSSQEAIFDELVELTACLFGVPISYMGLVDTHQMQYKAARGLAIPPPQPRAELLCSLVVKQGQMVVYQDLATASPTALDAPAIQNALKQQVRFYAGAPVRMPDQQVIGTLCLVSSEPREFSPEEQETLERIACLVSQAIVVRHHYRSASALGEAHWHDLQRQLGEEVFALGALVRYLLARYGAGVPVAAEILHPVIRRLKDLFATLTEE